MARIVKEPDVRRTELITCAQALFYTKGYDATSVSDIVKQADVAKGTFYYYFDSKQAVLEEMLTLFAGQARDIMQSIVDDDALPAIEKWEKAFLVTSNWKSARKEEMMTMLEIMMRDENVMLRHKSREINLGMMTPIIAQIIEQGVQEGVFDTAFVRDSAEITLAIMHSIHNVLADILLNPDQYPNGRTIATRKLNAITSAIERILGAQPGAINLFDSETLDQWFPEKKDVL